MVNILNNREPVKEGTRILQREIYAVRTCAVETSGLGSHMGNVTLLHYSPRLYIVFAELGIDSIMMQSSKIHEYLCADIAYLHYINLYENGKSKILNHFFILTVWFLSMLIFLESILYISRLS